MVDDSDKPGFVLELEDHTSVIHSTICNEYLERTVNGKYMDGWLGPFSTYTEAFETGSNLEGKSYPKMCGKCRVWDYKTTGTEVSTDLVLKEASIDDAFHCLKAWLIGKGSEVSEEQPVYISGVVQRQTSYGSEIYRENAKLKLVQRGEHVVINLTLSGKTAYGGQSVEVLNKRILEVKKELIYFLKDSLSSLDTERYFTYRDAFRNLGKTSRPLLAKVTEKTDDDKAPRSFMYFLILFSIGMLVLYGGVFFFFDTSYITDNFMELALTYGSAIAFFYWTYLSDKNEREPLVFILLMFCWGVFSGIIAAPLNGFIDDMISLGALAAPFIEEPVKALGLYVFLTHPKTRNQFNSPLDGIIYGFAVGMGFYASENFLYYLGSGIGTLLIRIILCWGHGLYVAIVGLWISVNRHYRGYNVPQDMIPGLCVAIVLHFAWNTISLFGIGRILLYYALFQFNYLRKIIDEAKRDEFYAGDDNIVFSSINEEKANTYSKSKILLVLIIVASIISSGVFTRGMLLGGSDEWSEYAIYGVKFDRPNRLWVETYGSTEGEEASETYGEVWLGNYRGHTKELIIIKYGSYGKLSFWRNGYDSELYGDEFEMGPEVEFRVNGHDGLYRTFNMTKDNTEFNCVCCAWSCTDSWRIFYTQVYLEEGNAKEMLTQILDSFECH